MALPDGFRQLVAGIIAAGAFLALFLGLDLVWWAALALATISYFALLLVIPRRKPLDEVMLPGAVSAADLRAATQALGDAASRLEAVVETVPAAEAEALVSMAADLRSIRTHMLSDPQDFRAARRFVVNYLPVVVATVEGFAKLSAQAHRAEFRERLDELGAAIRGLLRQSKRSTRPASETTSTRSKPKFRHWPSSLDEVES